MDFAGLIGKYSTQRAVTELELTHQLRQKQRLNVEPHYQLSVIKMNSTYLESVDKWYGSKGLLTTIAFFIFVIFIGFLGYGIASWMWDSIAGVGASAGESENFILLNGGGMLVILVLPISLGAVWLLRKESFAYTHYPIRFNRKTRMVHVFRTNGSVLSTPWDDLFFTMKKVDSLHGFWNVLGHILATDGKTVIESFALSISETGSTSGLLMMQSHWEFIRRYMEEGPASVYDQVQFCLPISERRETLAFGLRRLTASSSFPSLLMLPLKIGSMAFDLVTVPFRYFAMRTRKIPVWPVNVERSCLIESGDRYAIEGDLIGNRIEIFSDSA